MTSAASLYHSVINDVVLSIRDSFLDESVDESVLMELKTLWINKLDASKTIEPPARNQDQQLEARMAGRGRGGGARGAQAAAGAAASSSSRAAGGSSASAGAPNTASGQQVREQITRINIHRKDDSIFILITACRRRPRSCWQPARDHRPQPPRPRSDHNPCPARQPPVAAQGSDSASACARPPAVRAHQRAAADRSHHGHHPGADTTREPLRSLSANTDQPGFPPSVKT